MSISSQLNQYKNKNIHIVGIGSAEGSAIGEFLVGNGISSITGHDFSAEADFRKAFNNTHLSLKPKEREEALNHLLNLPIKINFKDYYLEGIENADMVFVSQVWFKYPQNMPILKDLYDNGVPFKTITNLYFELAPCKIISITGTNGKTTTARLINSIFEEWTTTPSPSFKGRGLAEDKPKVYFAGNDRQNIQVLDKLGEMKKDDVLILETSSTQLLLNSGISPHIGVITNITPNHIDDHGSFENYIEAKKNLIRYQNKNDFAILNEKLKALEIHKEIESKISWFSGEKELEEGCFVKNGKIIMKIKEDCLKTKELKTLSFRTPREKSVISEISKNSDFSRGLEMTISKQSSEVVVCSVDDIKILGKHNLENVLAAVSTAYLYGISLKIIKEGVSKYAGIKHRLKLLYDINGVKYYDDTQATTPEAAIAGIDSFDGDIILLAGGDNKGMKYEEMAEKINDKVKFLILFPGDASDEIEKFIDKNKIDFIKVKNFQQAIEVLKKYYKKTDLLKGGTVLISPGAAHFYSKFVESSGKDLKEWILSVSSI